MAVCTPSSCIRFSTAAANSGWRSGSPPDKVIPPPYLKNARSFKSSSTAWPTVTVLESQARAPAGQASTRVGQSS